MRDCVFADFSAWSGAIANGKTGQASIFVDEASLLIERVSHTAHSKGYKVVLMWLPERLRPEAANRLLKLIEEPPDDTVFIMTSDRPGEILGTIYSRTQRVTVNRYTEDEIVGYLCAHAGADPAAAGAAAVLADGSMAAALQLLSVDKERAMFLELFIRLMRLAWMRKIVPLREWSQEVAALGRDGSARFYGYCSRMLRENFILNVSGDNNLVTLTADEAAFSSKFCPYVNERNIVQLIEAVDEAIRDTRLNGNAKIISFDLAVRAILLLKR